MRSVRNQVWLLTLALTWLMPSTALSQPPPTLPPLEDLGRLRLRVTSTEVVQSIESEFSSARQLKAQEGFRLVVVTLEGTVPVPALVLFGDWEFSVLYEHEGQVDVRSADATACCDSSSSWFIASEGRSITTGTYFEKPGPLTIKVGVVLPEEVTTFHVRYPTLARGQATVPASPTQPPQQ